MASASSRLTDIFSGICCCHSSPTCIPMTGPLVAVSPNCFVNNLGQGRLSDLLIGNCGHPGKVVTGSPNVNANSLSKARVGSLVSGCLIGYIIIGSSNYNIS